MADQDEVHVSKEEARGGETPGIVRYVLGISIALAVIAMAAVVYFGWSS